MDLLWMILLLVLIRADAQRVTEVRGEEGGNLTLTCSITPTITDIYWFMEVYRGFRAGIGRTLGPHSSSYYSPDSESKYLMESNRLVVKDLTAEDSRLYSCGRRNQSGLHFVDSFNLTLGKTSVKTSGGSAHSQHQSCMTPQDLTYVSSSIMAALAAIGFVVSLVCMKEERHQVDDLQAFIRENSETLQTVQFQQIQSDPQRSSLGPSLQ
ncbi:uncharacterized protein LOC114432054 isoform X1 [Parambassis ranga]|uniref:Uncharacterized protein LOC114432054 isoform X1 n=1 Tax=Parambassis ranga TaxID=210632 RepID=A0A6P7HP85_9TELE|nr:uncharacterized protein LOC114432054 isoform X1 [Parambassis ranga]